MVSDRGKMGTNAGGEIAAAGFDIRRLSGAALVGIALHGSRSSAWHAAIGPASRAEAVSSGVFWMTLATSLTVYSER